MPPRTVSATLTFDLPPGAYVLGICRERAELDRGDVRIRLGRGIDPLRAVADRGVRHAHASVEPWPATETADDRNVHRPRHRRTGVGTGMAEVEQCRTRLLQRLCLRDEIGGRAAAVELREHRNPGTRERAHRLRRRQYLD